MELVEDYLKRQREESELICPFQPSSYIYSTSACRTLKSSESSPQKCFQGRCAIFDRRTGKCGFLSTAQAINELKKK